MENHITLTSCTITHGHQQYYTPFPFTDLKSRLEVTCLTPRRAALGRSCLGYEMPIIGVCPRVTCFYPATHASPWAAAEKGLLRMAVRARLSTPAGAVTCVCPALGGRVPTDGEQQSEGQEVLSFSHFGEVMEIE